MNKFKSGGFKKRDSGFGGGRPAFGGGRGGSGNRGAKFRGGRDSRSPELFQAVCNECNNQCQIPFRPSQDKPVYCRDCFTKQGYKPGRDSNGADGIRPDFRRNFAPQTNDNESMDAIKQKLSYLESKIDLILEIIRK